MRSSTLRIYKLMSVIMAVSLLFTTGALAFSGNDITVFAAGSFSYVHDPALNQSAMNDIVADETAVYGFRPSETGSLSQYAGLDWTDPEMVEEGRNDRIAYHQSLETMYDMLYEMTEQGKSTEEIARAVSARRNEIRLEAYSDDPEGLAVLKERNLEKYGHEEGPLPDELFEKYGSWEKVIEKSFSPNAGMDACLGLYDDYYETYVLLGMIADDSVILPDKVDLRDRGGKNYVTPVKFQNPFGTCWAFAVAAAAEECYLFDNDMGVPAGEKNEQINLSEKYLAWNFYHNISEKDSEGASLYIASQTGEGFDAGDFEKDNINAVLDMGGFPDKASNILMAGLGLMDEFCEVNGSFPFAYRGVNEWKGNNRDEGEELADMRRQFYYERNKKSIDELIEEGKISNADEFEQWFNDNWAPGKKLYENTFKYGTYSPVDDWSIPEGAEYFQTPVGALIKGIKTLQSPAQYDENGAYLSSDPEGLENIKRELAGGHAVVINIFADRSRPDDDDLTENCILNFDHWAQYYSGDKYPNHSVTIVGYDDNYPKENFTRTFEDHIVEGSTPPGDGAFIIKNSWGSSDCEPDSPYYSDWGFEKSGYFYLSYYDHSISEPMTFEFYSKDEVPYTSLYFDQYDFMFDTDYNTNYYVEEVESANVFEADEDSFIGWISTKLTGYDITLNYRIFKDPEEGKPTSGTLLESGKQTFYCPGYKTIELKNKYFLKKGEKYSVVILPETPYSSEETGDITVYPFVYPLATNYNASNGFRLRTVINEGESYFGYKDEWTDFTETAAFFREAIFEDIKNSMDPEEFDKLYANGMDDLVIDNLPIKAILVSDSEYTCPHTELENVPAKAPTTSEEGNISYYVCRLCGRWFEDSEGKNEITDHSSVVLPVVAEEPEKEPSDKTDDEDKDKPADETPDKPTDETSENSGDRDQEKPDSKDQDKTDDKNDDKKDDNSLDEPEKIVPDKSDNDTTDNQASDDSDGKDSDVNDEDRSDASDDNAQDSSSDDNREKNTDNISGDTLSGDNETSETTEEDDIPSESYSTGDSAYGSDIILAGAIMLLSAMVIIIAGRKKINTRL